MRVHVAWQGNAAADQLQIPPGSFVCGNLCVASWFRGWNPAAAREAVIFSLPRLTAAWR